MAAKLFENNKKIKITALVFASLLLLYALIGFLVLPFAIEKSLPKISKMFLQGREVTVGRIAINPFALLLAVDNLEIKGLKQDTLLSLQRFRVNFQTSSLFLQQWRFKQFELGPVTGNLSVLDDGSFNFSDILQKFASDEPKAEPLEKEKGLPAIWVEKLILQDIALAFVDNTKTPAFDSFFGPVSIGLDNFSTLKEKHAPYQLIAKANDGIIGKHLAWQGSVTVNPLSSSGKLEIEGLDISRWATYFQRFLNVKVKQGFLNVAGEYQLAMLDDGIELAVTKGSAKLSALDVQSLSDQQPLLRVNQLETSGVSFNYPDNILQVNKVELANSQVLVKLLADGSIPLVDALTPNLPETTAAEPASANAGPAFQLQVNDIILSNNEVQLEDNFIAKNTSWAIGDINAKLSNFSLQENKNLPIKLDFTINESARFNSEGQLQLFPYIASDIHTVLKTFELSNLQPYVDEYSFLQINKGRLAVELKHKISLEGPVDLKTQGEVVVSDFTSALANSKRTFLSFSELALEGIDFDLQKNALALKRVKINSINQRVVRKANGEVNVAQVLKPSDKGAGTSSEQAANPMAVNIGELKLNNAQLSFSDYAIKPIFLIELNKLSGSIKGLSSNTRSRASMNLKGRLDNHSDVHFSGDLNFLSEDLYTDILLDINNLNMSNFNSYSQTYVGRAIDKGKLNLGISYYIENQKLDAKNHFFLDQFELGGKVKSEQATNMPVGLAVALLKNPQGEITVDLPIHGDLNDPNFRYGKVVWNAIGNIIIKAASSPFSLLAGLVNTNADLSQFAFAPGSAELSEANVKKAKQIQQALLKRPELQLDVQGCYSQSLDGKALQKQALMRRLNPKQKDWDNDKWLKALHKDYRQQFNKDADFTSIDETLPETKQKAEKTALLVDELSNKETLPVDALLALARKRRGAIYSSLLADDTIAAKRVFVKDIQVLPEPTTELACALSLQ